MTYDELYHYGIDKQKWYVRRYQNPDGTYTEEGKIRKRAARARYSEDYELSRKDPNTLTNEELKRASDRKKTEAEYTDNRLKSSGVSKTTKYVTTGIAAAATALALGLAGKKIYDLRKSRKTKESENAEMKAILKDAEKIAVSRIKVDHDTQETLIKSFIAGAASQANNAGKNYGKNPEYWNEVLNAIKSSAKQSDMDDNAADILAHHGILGQRWGVRRYQNPDGSLTPLGRKRYGVKTYAELTPAQKREANRFDLDQQMREDKYQEEKMELRKEKEIRKSMKAEAAEERKDAAEAYRQEQAAKTAKRIAIGTVAATAVLGIGVALSMKANHKEVLRQEREKANIEAENLLSKIRIREANAASKRSIREARAGSKNMRRDARSSVLNSVSDWFKNRPREGKYTESRAAKSVVSDVIKSKNYSAGKSAVKSIALDKDTRLLLTGPTSSSKQLLSETKRLLLPGPKG